ncbi:MAG: 50S ribosomal protein L6 [Actinomycetota bacterium]|jgi:large subunit ribosomal protein L6|nr:50S ribosomal protein L6 [Euzebyaceae bacterium]MDQ3451159.1 50S ribosomal protein L6 [Actinomycetota bacterium]
MSRIGKQPVAIPSGVDVSLSGSTLTVTGPRGTLTQRIHPDITVDVADGEVRVTRPDDEREHRSLHGLFRSLIANMVTGVTDGYTRRLEIVGVGYRAAARGNNGLTLQMGFSHPVEFNAPEGISFQVASPTRIAVSGADKQLVGQVAANIRAIRRPEPYKGKGIRYEGEQIRRKSGKAAG